MNILGARGLATLLAATVTFVGIGALAHISSAMASRDIGVSSNVTGLPQRPDVILSPLSLTDIPRTRGGGPLVSPQQALAAAQREFGIPDAQIDQGIGVVRARFTARAARMHQQEKVYIITADVQTPSQSPFGSSVVYQKLCIVVSAVTGRYELAYAADPTRPAAR